jgi:hypothetical protein
MRIALVTLAIGDKYLEIYNILFRPSQEAYAKRHGYEFRVVTEYLDEDLLHKSLISFQKALVFSQPWSKNYDFIIFVDADIYIRPDSPPIHIFSGDKIAIVNEFAQPTKELRLALQARCGWETSGAAYYALCQMDLETDIVPNSGVILASPEIHGDYLRNIYEHYKELAIHHPRGFIYEQAAIGYCLVRDDMCICIPNEWNGLWMINKLINPDKELPEFISETYFTHLAGKFQYEKLYEFLLRPIHPDTKPATL